jgi:hypothetical protein
MFLTSTKKMLLQATQEMCFVDNTRGELVRLLNAALHRYISCNS